MGWWDQLSRFFVRTRPPQRQFLCALELPGWIEESPPDGVLRLWRHERGTGLTLAHCPPPAKDLRRFRDEARGIATAARAGLLEAEQVDSNKGVRSTLVYKVLVIRAYRFTGMVFTNYMTHDFIWVIVDSEIGTTGIREAAVTADLLVAGELTPETYPSAWHDPYDSAFDGVDRSCMRFTSDDARFDERFPHHPLTRVRELQRWILSSRNAETIALETVESAEGATH